jgi:1,4-alpha-glucan branching enzyme
LRLNRNGFSRGLCGQNTQVYHLHEDRKVIAFRRWDKGGPGDDVVVVANFFHEPQDGHMIGFPAVGTWKLRFNSDWQGYDEEFKNHPSGDIIAVPGNQDGLAWQSPISVGSYSVLIFSQ